MDLSVLLVAQLLDFVLVSDFQLTIAALIAHLQPFDV